MNQLIGPSSRPYLGTCSRLCKRFATQSIVRRKEVYNLHSSYRNYATTREAPSAAAANIQQTNMTSSTTPTPAAVTKGGKTTSPKLLSTQQTRIKTDEEKMMESMAVREESKRAGSEVKVRYLSRGLTEAVSFLIDEH